MSGFEKVFKNGRVPHLDLSRQHKRRETSPNIRAMEAELKKIKEECFEMKCKIKATDALVRLASKVSTTESSKSARI